MENELFAARIRDTAEICVRTAKPKFIGFLSETQAAQAAELLKKTDCGLSFFGGYEGAERVMLCCLPSWCEKSEFPIGAVTFSFKDTYTLSHRDVLGTLMSLGIKRETVGDILVEPGRAVVFATREICPYIEEQIDRIGGVGVKPSPGFLEPLPEGDAPVDGTATASSGRLDCVVAALCGFSRSRASEVIASGTVAVNSLVCEKGTRSILPGDKITVRGKGKYSIDSMDGRTKKDRMILTFKKYR